MNILLHICCAPCLISPLEIISSKEHDVTGFFLNNNIHPFTEFTRRLDALKEYAETVGLSVIYDESYDIDDFFESIVFNEENRCTVCYYMRLKETAKKAAEGGYDAFSTTLLYSKYQNHEKIKSICEELAHEHSVAFYYEDFRVGWGRGIKKSKKIGMYRQQYCGCIYSERDRYKKVESSEKGVQK